MFLASGVRGVLRLAVSLVFLVYAFALVALGSGIPQLAELFGVKITLAQNVFFAALLFGATVLWDNAVLRRKLTSHAAAPNLLWQGVTVTKDGQGFQLTVACKNDGSTARLDRASEVLGTRSYFGDSASEAFAIHWGLDAGGYIETGVFDLVMQCDNAVDAADHRVTWRIVYWDSHFGLAYLTECSAVVRKVLGSVSVVEAPSLDPTSPAQRHAAYRGHYRQGAAGHSTRIV